MTATSTDNTRAEAVGRIAGQVWAIRPDALEALLEYAAGETASLGVGESAGMASIVTAIGGERDGVEPRSAYVRAGGIGIVPVHGVLGYGNNTYESIIDGVEAVTQDVRAGRGVRGVMLHVDSPGGLAAPSYGASDRIYDVRESGVPVWAFTPGLMASAGAELGAQASRVLAGPGAFVGSIGSMMVSVEMSRRLERLGISAEAIKSRANKDTGSPFRAMTDDDRRALQAEVDQHGRQVVATVARGRGMPYERVDALADGEEQGPRRGYVGAEAVRVGLADAVVTDLRAALAAMEAEHGETGTNTRGFGSAGMQSAAATVAAAGSAVVALSGVGALNGTEGPAMGVKDKDDGAGAVIDSAGADTNGDAAAGATATADAGSAPPSVDVDALTKRARDAGTKAERDRVAAIASIGGRFAHVDGVSDLIAKASEGDTEPEAFRMSLIEHVAEKNRPLAQIPAGYGASVTAGDDARDKRIEALSLNLAVRMLGGPEAFRDQGRDGHNPGAEMARAIGFDSPEAAIGAHREACAAIGAAASTGRVSVQSLLVRSAATAMGLPTEDVRDMLATRYGAVVNAAAGHGSGDFPLLFEAAMHKTLQAQFRRIPVVWTSVCRTGISTDYKNHNLYRVSDTGHLKLVPEGAQPEQTTVAERREQIAVEKYGRAIGLTYEMVRNDDLNAFGQQLTRMASNARLIPELLLMTLLAANSNRGPVMSDGLTFFHATHGNIGTAAALGYDSLETGWTEMSSREDFGNAEHADTNYISVEPSVLLTATGLHLAARRILENDKYPKIVGVDQVFEERNLMAGRLTPVHTPRKTGPRWWLFTDPAVSEAAAFQCNFLDGDQTPVVEPITIGDSFNMNWHVMLKGCGMAGLDYEAGRVNDGQ